MVVVNPELAHGSSRVESIVDGDAKLECVVVAGNPAPRVTWSHRGEVLNQSSNRVRVLEDGSSSLYVKNVTVDDVGEYVCTATNVGGTASSTLRLDVLGKS